MSERFYSVRLAASLPQETVERILDGMWTRLVRENGEGKRSDASAPSVESAYFTDHAVTWRAS